MGRKPLRLMLSVFLTTTVPILATAIATLLPNNPAKSCSRIHSSGLFRFDSVDCLISMLGACAVGEPQKVISTSRRAISLISALGSAIQSSVRVESGQALRMYVHYYKNAIIRAITRTFGGVYCITTVVLCCR